MPDTSEAAPQASYDTIDFLPARYRDDHHRRQWVATRGVVVVVFGLLIAASIYAQQVRVGTLRARLDDANLRGTEATTQAAHLTASQSQLHLAQKQAELFTFLRHPWPRTQILAAILDPLPPEVQLTSLQITAERIPIRSRQTPTNQRAAQQQVDHRTPAERALAKLREALDPVQTVVILQGVTTANGELHRYLGRLANDDLLTKPELRSLDGEQTPDGPRSRFDFRITVVPAHGETHLAAAG